METTFLPAHDHKSPAVAQSVVGNPVTSTAPTATANPTTMPVTQENPSEKQTTQMWSAVALQQHLTRQLASEGRLAPAIPAPRLQRL